jgi:hypothetical protein
MPKYIGSSYDTASRIVTVTFSFTNPLKSDLKVNSIAADVECTAHTFPLGRAELDKPVLINPGETRTIEVVFTWTQTAENHFLTEHPNAKSIDILLVNLDLDISGMTIETPESVALTIPLVP